MCIGQRLCKNSYCYYNLSPLTLNGLHVPLQPAVNVPSHQPDEHSELAEQEELRADLLDESVHRPHVHCPLIQALLSPAPKRSFVLTTMFRAPLMQLPPVLSLAIQVPMHPNDVWVGPFLQYPLAQSLC